MIDAHERRGAAVTLAVVAESRAGPLQRHRRGRSRPRARLRAERPGRPARGTSSASRSCRRPSSGRSPTASRPKPWPASIAIASRPDRGISTSTRWTRRSSTSARRATTSRRLAPSAPARLQRQQERTPARRTSDGNVCETPEPPVHESARVRRRVIWAGSTVGRQGPPRRMHRRRRARPRRPPRAPCHARARARSCGPASPSRRSATLPCFLSCRETRWTGQSELTSIVRFAHRTRSFRSRVP